ncbi:MULTISPECIES: hypothetical protein [unclassified Pseudomonas]|uniref:hypothetical protein n=1 Tax=unclassified Pseudomonas TaxID=196821 RepID=UPI001179E4A6|nr:MULTISPECIES: hypothetical protein [unclassified Pseudomonas]
MPLIGIIPNLKFLSPQAINKNKTIANHCIETCLFPGLIITIAKLSTSDSPSTRAETSDSTYNSLAAAGGDETGKRNRSTKEH